MKLLGPHTIKSTGDALNWARHANVCKALDDPAPLKVAPDGALRVYRAYFPEREQRSDVDPANVADTILARLGGYRHPNLYVETFNETQWSAADLVRFHRVIVPMLHAAGVKVCAPAWSTGAFEVWDWAAFREAGWCGLDAIGLHAYWGNQGFSIWHALRWRQFWQPGDPPVIVTECGRDAVEGGKGGWRKDGVTEDAYWAELRAYDAELVKDAYVLGATVFTAGPSPGQPPKGWEPFDADPFAGRAVAAAEPYPTDRQAQVVESAPQEPERDNPKEQPMTNPWAGRGILVWNLPADVSELIAVGKKVGADYFDVKIANGGSSWAGGRVKKAQVDAIKAAGFRVTGWIYDYDDLGGVRFSQGDGVPELEAQALAEAAKALGVDGVTLDLEIECEGHGDLVAIEIAKVRELLPGMPLAAHTWADLHGHDAYPMDVIASSVDVVRPMCYAPVWRAREMYASLWTYLVGRKVAPVWGATEGSFEQIAEDRAFPVPVRIDCIGESYWEYEAVKNRQDELAALFGSVAESPPAAPETPSVPQEPAAPAKPDYRAIAAHLRALADEIEAMAA